jgi:hypothetical protein
LLAAARLDAGVELHRSRCRWGTWPCPSWTGCGCSPAGDRDHRRRARRWWSLLMRQVRGILPQSRGQRRPGRRAAGADPPQRVRPGTDSRCSTCGTPAPAYRRVNGSGSSSGRSASTTAGAPTPAAPASGWPSRAATPAPTAATWSAWTQGGPGALFRLTLPLAP